VDEHSEASSPSSPPDTFDSAQSPGMKGHSS
jgi:hypothetical protein